ncbi:hypothetical protein JYT16_00180 [Gemmatimonas aurantiaca]|nr:hypothetical protein [Gemmatimonas aurantiaca]
MRKTKKNHECFIFIATLNTVFCLALLGVLPQTGVLHAQEITQEQGIIDYYISTAREGFGVSDIRKITSSFTAIIILRQYTIEANGDTLQIDTALVRLHYNLHRSETDQVPDTLSPDSIEILQSDFVNSKPNPPELFVPPPWEVIGTGERAADYRLLPDDPSSEELAIDYMSGILPDIPLQSGLFLLERTSGRLTYTLSYREVARWDKRHSRECRYQMFNGFLVPEFVLEHKTERTVFGGWYFVIEARVITLRFE